MTARINGRDANDNLPNGAVSNGTATIGETARYRIDGLLFAVITAILMVQLPHIPAWAIPMVLGGLVWRFQHDYGRWPRPPKALLAIVTLGSAAAVFVNFGGFWGREPGLALLVIGSILKLLESRQRRDSRVLLLLGFFLIITLLLFDQGFLMLVLVLTLFWLLLAAWIGQSMPTPEPPPTQPMPRHEAAPTPIRLKPRLRSALGLMLAGLPVAIALFLLFPRPPGALWGTHQPGVAATTGLSEHLRPGAFERLGKNPEIAFRAHFDGKIIPPTKRYWRVMVMTNYDGHQWQAVPPLPSSANLRLVPESKVGYTITLEPTHQRWMIGLDMPLEAPPQSRLDANLTLRAQLPIEDRYRYSLHSALDYLLDPDHLGRYQRRADLAYPANANPRLQALARQWRGLTPEAIRDKALNYFRDHGFRYSLSPGRLPTDNAMDAFLFQTRVGYCEHYASAFALLMRAAGVPARIVTGYQGGELNGDYLVVRQSDAHAWDEIWIHGKGWIRVDPTRVVAPERISEGIANAVRNDTALPDTIRRINSPERSIDLLTDRLENGWNQWVLGYSADTQNQLLDRLGLHHLGLFGLLVLALAVTGAIWWLSLWILRRLTLKRGYASPLDHSWDELEQALARFGLERGIGETRRRFTDRCTERMFEEADELRRTEVLLSRAMYGPKPSQMQVDRCSRAAKGLKDRLNRRYLHKRLRQLIRGSGRR